MATTAEGVETLEQFKTLSGVGCTEVQGYLFSPAVPGSQVPELLRRIPAMFDAFEPTAVDTPFGLVRV